jgi:SAM-dependent methyltransferase
MTPPSSRCPLCGAGSVHALTAWDRNRESTSERFSYNRCTACGTLHMIDPPQDLARYYGGDYHGFGADGEPEWTRNPTLQAVEDYRMDMLREHVAPGRLIDVGAGAGAFAAAAHGEGYEVTAVEMDERCCAYMREHLGVQAICSDDPLAALRAQPPADVISLWHSLEHLRDPAAMLAAAAERLLPGGVLALGVPNPRSLQFRLLGARWAHLDAPRHLCLMPERALVAHLGEHGLRPLQVTTGDPFGVICSVHGWTYALRRRPARADSPAAAIHAARLITRALAPLEQRRRAGPALTLLLGRD